MNNKNNDEKKRLEVLERFLGFLGVMIALAMTLAWDFITSSKFETISKQDQVGTYVLYIICILDLCFVCLFYFWLYLGDNETAEFTGKIVMYGFGMVLILGVAPIRPYILPVFDEFIIYTIQLVGIFLISYCVGYYLPWRKIVTKLKTLF